MKRIIYILTAILSASAAAIFIIEYILSINQSGFYIPYFIAVLLAISILSFIQLKKPTPRIMLLLCGYVFFESVLMIKYMYLFGMLLMAAALVPAVYELSHYGMMVRQEPQQSEKNRWMLAAALPLALALCAFMVMLIVTQASLDTTGGVMVFPMDYSGIAALLCTAVFCALMSRRTSVLYRLFFAGCVIFYAVQSISSNYFIMHYFLPDSADIFFISMAAIYLLFISLIMVHTLITRRGSLTSKLTREAQDHTGQAFDDAVKEG